MTSSETDKELVFEDCQQRNEDGVRSTGNCRFAKRNVLELGLKVPNLPGVPLRESKQSTKVQSDGRDNPARIRNHVLSGFSKERMQRSLSGK